jgi:hypothetical protein
MSSSRDANLILMIFTTATSVVPLLALLLALPLSNADASPLTAEVANCRAFLQSTVTASYGAVQEHCGPRVLKHLASLGPHRDVQAIMARTNGACRERYAGCSFDTAKQLVALVHGATDSANQRRRMMRRI